MEAVPIKEDMQYLLLRPPTIQRIRSGRTGKRTQGGRPVTVVIQRTRSTTQLLRGREKVGERCYASQKKVVQYMLKASKYSEDEIRLGERLYSPTRSFIIWWRPHLFRGRDQVRRETILAHEELYYLVEAATIQRTRSG
jgi:hypothetical protein